MFGLGTTELIIILVIVIMFFGLGKLPQVAKELGSGVRNFQKSLKGEDEDEESSEPEKKQIEGQGDNQPADPQPAAREEERSEW